MPRNPLFILQHCGITRATAKTLSEEQAEAEWEAVHDLRDQALAQTLEASGDAFAELAQRIDPAGVVALFRSKSGLSIATTFNLDAWLTELLDKLFGAQADNAEAGYRVGLLRTAYTTSSTFIFSGRARQVAQEALANLSNINETTAELLSGIVERGLSGGLSDDVIASQIHGVLDEWSSSRAATIARTVATPVFEASQLDGYEEAGVQLKGWLSQRSSTTRDAHHEADGQEVELDASFMVGGEMLRFPGDPLGSPGNIINCRCSTYPVIRENKALLPFNDRERQRIEHAARDFSIRTSYQMLKPEHKQSDLIALLAKNFSVSESLVKKAVWG